MPRALPTVQRGYIDILESHTLCRAACPTPQALHHAARGGHVDTVRVLLDLGARVNVTTWGRCSCNTLPVNYPYYDACIARILSSAGESTPPAGAGAP